MLIAERMRISCKEGGNRVEHSFAENLRYLRKRKGFTQKELADLLQVSEITINRYETGAVPIPRSSRLKKLAEVLGVSEGDLMGWQDSDLSGDVHMLARGLQSLPEDKRKQVIALLSSCIDALSENTDRPASRNKSESKVPPENTGKPENV